MSRLFFERMQRELASLHSSLSPPERGEVDREVERITGKDCDDAARSLSKEEFKEVAEAAVRGVKQRAKRRTGRATMTAESLSRPMPDQAKEEADLRSGIFIVTL